MSARTRHRWLIWLLPLIALRALLPAGFMFAWADGAPRLMLCSGMGAVPAVVQNNHPSAHAHHAGHAGHDAQATEHSQHQNHSSSPSHENSLCPFAAGGVANVSPPQVVAALFSVATDLLPLAAQPELRSATVLIDRIRGPPLA